MDPLARLARPDKDTLIGNLCRGVSDGAGISTMLWAEELVTREALGIYLLRSGRLAYLGQVEQTWRPDRIEARHSAGDLQLDELKFVHHDALVTELTFRNVGSGPLEATVIVLSDLEGRKASAACHDLPGAPGACAVLADLQTGRGFSVAFGSTRPPDALRWAPFRKTLVRLLAERQGPPLQAQFKQDLLNCGMAFDLALAPGETASWSLAIAARPTPQEALHALATPLAGPAACREAATAAWHEFFEHQVPRFACSDPSLVDLYYYVWHVQQVNRMELGNRRLPWPFGAPAKFKYSHLWFWDACLQAITLRWLRDPAYSFGNLRSAANQQYPDGMLPHETALAPETMRRNWPDGDGQSSSVTQPPVLGLALWEVYAATGDRALLADVYPALARYDRWFEACRDEDGDHLFAFVHRWETGWDNSPRWDGGFDVEPVEVNALIAIQRQVLADVAELLGWPEEAAAHRARAQETADAVRRLMWDGAAGMYCDLLAGHAKSPVHTPAAFCTLLAGLPTPEQAAALVDHLTNPARFWTRYPVPVVPQDDPEFDPNDYWRGPTWIHINWLIVQGLLRYGYRDVAAELVRRTFQLMGGQGRPTCNECYNPLTGEEARTPDLSWSGLVNDLVITCVGGIRPRADGRLACDPLDLGLESFHLQGVPYRGHRIDLAYDRAGGYRVAVDGREAGRRPDLGPLGPFALG